MMEKYQYGLKTQRRKRMNFIKIELLRLEGQNIRGVKTGVKHCEI